MEGYSAEVTRAEAASVMSDRELHLGDSGYAALCDIIGVEVTRVWQGIYSVKLLTLKGRHRRILHEHLVTVILDDRLTVHGVGVFILYGERLCIGALVCLKLVIVAYLEAVEVDGITLLGKVYCASDVAYFLHGYALIKKLCESYENILAHTVGEDIRS